MFDEKHFIEKLTGIKNLYSTIEQLRGDLKLNVENDVELKPEKGASLVYRHESEKRPLMEINHYTSDAITAITYRYQNGAILNIYVRNKEVEISSYDGEVYRQWFIVGDKLYFYNQESMRNACSLSGGIAHLSSAKEYEAVSVMPDSIEQIEVASEDLGEQLAFAVAHVIEVIDLHNKKTKK